MRSAFMRHSCFKLQIAYERKPAQMQQSPCQLIFNLLINKMNVSLRLLRRLELLPLDDAIDASLGHSLDSSEILLSPNGDVRNRRSLEKTAYLGARAVRQSAGYAAHNG